MVFKHTHYKQFWAARRDDLAEMERALVAEPWSAAEVDALLACLVERRDAIAGMIRDRFGVDVATTPPRILPWCRDPQDDWEHELWSKLIASHRDVALLIGELVVEVLPLPPDEQGPKAASIAIAVARDRHPHFVALMMKLSPSAVVQGAAAHALAGWAHYGSKLKDTRLGQNVDDEARSQGMSPAAILAEELPGQVWLATEDVHAKPWDAYEFLGAIVNPLARVAQGLSGGAVPLLEGRVVSPSAEQEFLARHNAMNDERQAEEQLRRCQLMWEAAKLSPQQSRIMTLYWEQRTTKQIAEELGLPSEQVDDQRKKARRKLRTFLRSPGVAERWQVPQELRG